MLKQKNEEELRSGSQIRMDRKSERGYPQEVVARASAALRRIEESQTQVTALLQKQTNKKELEMTITVLGECVQITAQTRKELSQTISELQNHPLAYELDLVSEHPLIRGGKEQRILEDIIAVTEKLRLGQIKEEEVRNQREQVLEKSGSAHRALEANDAHRSAAEREIAEIEGARFGFGILPGTRERNRQRLDAAQETLRTTAGAESTLASEIRRADEAVEQIERTLERTRDVTVRERKEMVRMIASFFKNIGVETPLDNFSIKVQSAVEKIEEFDRQLKEKIFVPLRIADKDEERFHSETVPENVSKAVRETRELTFENIRNLIAHFSAYFIQKDKTLDEISADLQIAVAEAGRDAYIGWNERVAEIEAVLESKEVKPAPLLSEKYQSKSATGMAGMHRRREVERGLGFEENEYPIYLAYGHAADWGRGPAPGFGAIHLSFPLERFRFRATCTLGDSLNPGGTPYSLTRGMRQLPAVLDARRRSVALEHAPLARALLDLDEQYEPKRRPGVVNFIPDLSYVEVQIADRVRVADASELVLSCDTASGEIDALAKQFANVRDFSERLRQQSGLPVRVAGEPHAFDSDMLSKYPLYRETKTRYETWFKE